MKKAVSLLLVTVFLLLCGCSFNTEKFKENFKDSVSKINSDVKNTVNLEEGIFISEHIKKSQIKKLQAAHIVSDGVHTLCYDLLSKNQKQIYKIMFSAATEMTNGWFECTKFNKNFTKDAAVAYKALNCDNPQMFWLPTSYMVANGNNSGCIAFKYQDDSFTNDYLVSKNTVLRIKSDFDNKVSEVTALASAYTDEFEKELFVHDWLCKNADYDLNGGPYIYTAYGAICGGKCVCEGYSRAMQLIMQNLGITCGLIYGTYEEIGHMWNYIVINGDPYHLDITWDDSEEFGTLHQFFNLTDEQIAKTHETDEFLSENTNPEKSDNYNILKMTCTAQTENYYNRLGLYLTDNNTSNITAVLSCVYKDFPFAELKAQNTIDTETLLKKVSRALYGKVTLEKYTAIDDIIIVTWQK